MSGEVEALKEARGRLLSIAARMVRLEGGCEKGHKAGRWHMHEEPYHATGRDLAATVRSWQQLTRWQLTRVGDEERLRGRRLVLVADDLLEKWGTRTERGERITAEWGEPDERGWYDPTFTVHADDRLVDEERLRTAIDGVTNDPDDPSDPDAWTYNGTREELAAELVAALAPEPPSPASQGEER